MFSGIKPKKLLRKGIDKLALGIMFRDQLPEALKILSMDAGHVIAVNILNILAEMGPGFNLFH